MAAVCASVDVVLSDDIHHRGDLKRNHVNSVMRFDVRQTMRFLNHRRNPLFKDQPIFSEVFVDESGFKWRVKVMAQRQQMDQSFGVFLENANDSPIFTQQKWSRQTSFCFKLRPPLVKVNEDVMTDDEPKFAAQRDFTWNFTSHGDKDQGNWSCFQATNIADVMDENGDVEIVTEVYEKVPRPPYNSKNETGMVGLKNQGATCYMNSLLQTLFHCNKLREAVYSMPVEPEGANGASSMAFALQRVFCDLQTSDDSVSTRGLTNAFGWQNNERFMQQDVQELNRILCDKLEEKMKGTVADGTIKDLFEGKVRSFIRCVNVDFESAREESFYDISLDVKGCSDLEESFKKYVEVERLDGENQYDAEGEFGKQDAEKGVRFLEFPPVLNLQLKRFEFDLMTGNMVKINDKFEFPERLDLDPFLAESTPIEEAVKEVDPPSSKNAYLLHSVLVHSGGVGGGHYYVYIRPQKSFTRSPVRSKYFKFDDDMVEAASDEEALAFGGVRAKGLMNSCTSAYMLVYVREDELPKVMKPVESIPQHLTQKFDQESLARQAQLRVQQKAAQMADIFIVTIEDVGEYNLFRKIDDLAIGRRIKINRNSCNAQLVLTVSKRFNVPISRLRLWGMEPRDNGPRRPNYCITEEQLRETVVFSHKKTVFYLEVLNENEYKTLDETSKFCGLRVFSPPATTFPLSLSDDEDAGALELEDEKLELDRVMDEYPPFFYDDTHVFCFFKSYDPARRVIPQKRVLYEDTLHFPAPASQERELVLHGSVYISRRASVDDLAPLFQLFGVPQSTAQWGLYDWESIESVSKLKRSSPFGHDMNMVHGDVVVIARAPPPPPTPPLPYDVLYDDSTESEDEDEKMMEQLGIDTIAPLPASLPQYMKHRRERFILRLFPKSYFEPVPSDILQAPCDQFELGVSGCFELDFPYEVNLLDVQKRIARVIGMPHPLRIRLFDSFKAEDNKPNPSYQALPVDHYKLKQSALEFLNPKLVNSGGRRFQTVFYEESPYDVVGEFSYSNTVFEISINNFALIQKLEFESPTMPDVAIEGEGDESSIKRANQHPESVEELIMIKEDANGHRSRCVLNRTTGIVTLTLFLPRSVQVDAMLNIIQSIYPEFGPSLRLIEVTGLHVGTMSRIAGCYNLPKSALSNDISYNHHQKVALLETELEEDVTELHVLLFVKDRDAGFPNAISVYDPPHVTFYRSGDRLAEIIQRVQPLFAPTAPQLTECAPALVRLNSTATYVTPESAQLPFDSVLTTNGAGSDYSSSVVGLGFEYSPSSSTQVKRYKKAEGIRINC